MEFKKLTLNAKKPNGFWGKLMIRRMNNRHLPLINWGLKSINIQPFDKIIDVGCGGGNAINIMCKDINGGNIYGVDYSALSVANAKKLNHKAVASHKVKVFEASVAELPFNDNAFDIATAFETIYFWPDLEDNLKEVNRVLKPQGTILIVCEMFKDENCNKDEQAIVDMLDMNSNYKTREELENILRNAGFNTVSSRVDNDNHWIALTAKK